MPYIETTDKTQLYYKDWGAGRPVILLHGWPLSSDSWDDQSLAFANAGLRVIAYDRRGFGRSSQPWDGYNYDTLADDLAAVIDRTGAQDASIVGFSMGGGEVARYMSRHGGKNVKQAALVASIVPYMLQTPDNPNGVPKETFDEMAAGMKEDRAKFFASFFETFYGVGLMSQPVSQEVVQWSRQVAMMAGLKPTLACAEAFATTDFRSELSSFNAPTLIIHGTSDQTVPIEASAREAEKGIRGAHLIEYDGAPHGLLASHKIQVTNDLLRFLKG